MVRKSILSPEDPRWEDFVEHMEVRANCDHTTQHAETFLRKEKDMDVEGTLDYFKSRGGYCDCEILLNVIYL